MKTLLETNYLFSRSQKRYRGKVRDVYTLDGDLLVMVSTDRISAFDVILPRGIPYKGQILNQIASFFLDSTSDVCPNWKLSVPDPVVMIGRACKGFPVEMIVRDYLCGSAWRAYQSGQREICGIRLPDGMRENQRFAQPILTPTTKAEHGLHDENISKAEIIHRGLVSETDYEQMENYALSLFQRGTEIAAQRGLILVDTKYEFGTYQDTIYLIDEIHTPDSSRYFYAEEYEQRFERGEKQRQLSKEFVREWLLSNGFQGLPGQQMPLMTDTVVQAIADRYIELYEHLTGQNFVPADTRDVKTRVENNVIHYLNG
ncbi:MAG: phosphoribosylaminoimidazolesuccinocarboxamide synthase [Bacteroidales bacterium]|jgi:phosphoribosylaminoimidazole-succinocarboxamide synthase|nr:phosphoribosylaminoimidazolesuccinocarboxamide synthase [Bacteroidales bacterium]